MTYKWLRLRFRDVPIVREMTYYVSRGWHVRRYSHTHTPQAIPRDYSKRLDQNDRLPEGGDDDDGDDVVIPPTWRRLLL